MAQLIADSGSTKTEWILLNGNSRETFHTEGLNPYYHTPASLSSVLKLDLMPHIEEGSVEELHFYGAGCDGLERSQNIHEALDSFFPDAFIEVQSDLLAAARACFFDESGLVGILGTGSNSGLYDGHEIVEQIPSLGFILGDEGSAGYLGKKLINSYFRFEVPVDLRKELEGSFDMSLDHIMHGLYEGAQKSRFIGSYSAFLAEHSQHPWVKNLLREGFDSFINRILKKYTDAPKYAVGLVGSVAFGYKNLIEELLKQEGFERSIFIKKPLDRLTEYHSK